MNNDKKEQSCDDFIKYLHKHTIELGGNVARTLAIVWNGSNNYE